MNVQAGNAAGVRTARGRIAVLLAVAFHALAGMAGAALAEQAPPPARHPVGITPMEHVDPSDGRTLSYLLVYPAAASAAAPAFRIPLSANLHLYKDAPFAAGDSRRPLVVLSHGAGGNGSGYAWFGEYLAARGYVVALAYHYRAHTFDSSALYVRNRLWQRPRDIALTVTHLLRHETWGPRIDAGRIGVAGHSQGGFTALWTGGANVNPELFTAYQRGWRNNEAVPAHLRREMQVDAGPARNLRDDRVKAAFAMAPGDIKAFGMDEAGLAQMAIPAYIIVGAGDATTPPEDNAAFAAKHIPRARLDVLPGPVGHEIFTNECDRIGRDNYPEACVDAPGVDRAGLHGYIGAAALRFFDAQLGVRR